MNNMKTSKYNDIYNHNHNYPRDNKNIKDKVSGDLRLINDNLHNGVIVDTFNNIVCHSLPFLHKKSELKKELKKTTIPIRYMVESCDDGTVIRLYNYKGEWKIATSRCIDATLAFWQNKKSFAEMFLELFDFEFYSDILDINCTYIFVMLYKSNRNIIKYDESKLNFIVKINNKNSIEEYDNPFILYSEPNVLPDLYSGNNIDEYMNKHVDLYTRGIIVKELCLDSGDNFYFKTYLVDSKDFYSKSQVRGNVADIKKRYLQILSKEWPTMIFEKSDALEKEYPEYASDFQKMMDIFERIVEHLYTLYMDTLVQKKYYISHNTESWKFLKTIHYHVNNTTNVSKTDIRDVLYTMPDDMYIYIINVMNTSSMKL